MANMHLMLFLCLVAPLSMMLSVLRGRSRALLAFLLTGTVMCLLAGEINGLIANRTDLSFYFMTVNITPIVEEILKALPIIYIAFLICPSRQLLLEASVAVGVGFATMENTYLIFDYGSSLTIGELLARGFGAGMMHGICTLAVGFSMTFVEKNRKMSCAGTVASLSVAIIYHSVYNIMVQSQYPIIGILLPAITYLPLIPLMIRNRNGAANRTDEQQKKDSDMSPGMNGTELSEQPENVGEFRQ